MGCPQAASIRTLNIALVVTCVVIIATLCTSLAVWSGDRALRDTKSTCDESLTLVYDAGHSTVMRLTQDYLNQQSATAVKQLDGFFGVTYDMTNAMCNEIASQPDNVKTGWDYLYGFRSRVAHLVRGFHQFDGAGIVTVKYQVMTVHENVQTLGRGPTDYHQLHSVTNNGSDYDHLWGPAVNRTMYGDVKNDGLGTTHGYPESYLSFEKGECEGEAVIGIETNGSQLQVPCLYEKYDVHTAYFGLFTKLPLQQTRFLHLLSLGRYAGILSQCVYADAAGTRLGLFWTGADLRKVTLFLQTLDLGEERGSLGRVFITVRNHWAVGQAQFGYLAGTSHGTSVVQIPDPVYGWSRARVGPIPAKNCSDSLVSSTAEYLERSAATQDSLYEEITLNNTHHEFTLATERKPSGESFYVSVHRFDNQKGLDWYVVTVVDREYMMGQVDKTEEDTRKRTSDRAEAVDKDLDEARTVLYVVVIVTAGIAVSLCVFLVFRITQPLIRLMQDMSYVAVMNLELVDVARPRSFLSEVQQMEGSFRQMVCNLEQYKQYLPQSVLVDTVTTEEDDDLGERSSVVHRSTVSGGRSSFSVSSNSCMHSAVASVFDTGLRKKCITIAVSNLGSLLQLRSESQTGTLLSEYLEMVVQTSKKYRGIVDDVSGDRVAVSFNTSIPSPNHRTKGAEYAMLLQGKWRDQLKMNSALASGTALCGSIGCTGLKKFSTLGAVACNARMVERCGRAWNVPLLCDGTVASDARELFIFRIVVKATLKLGNDSLLHELICHREAANDEWMYQLEQSAASDPMRLINAAMTLLYQGECSEAKLQLTGCSLRGAAFARCLMQEVQRTGAPPAPHDIFSIPPLGEDGCDDV